MLPKAKRLLPSCTAANYFRESGDQSLHVVIENVVYRTIGLLQLLTSHFERKCFLSLCRNRILWCFGSYLTQLSSIYFEIETFNRLGFNAKFCTCFINTHSMHFNASDEVFRVFILLLCTSSSDPQSRRRRSDKCLQFGKLTER